MATTELITIERSGRSSRGTSWQIHADGKRYTVFGDEAMLLEAGDTIRASVEQRDYEGKPWLAITSFEKVEGDSERGKPAATSRDPWSAPPRAAARQGAQPAGAATFVAAVVAAAVRSGQCSRAELGAWAAEARRVAGDVLGGA